MKERIGLLALLLLAGCGDGAKSRPSEDAGNRCSSPAECRVPAGCWFAGCVGGVCTFEPVGCERPKP